MADRLARGVARLARRLQDAASHEVVYTRGASSDTILATSTVGPLLQMADASGAVRMGRVERDFLIHKDTLPYAAPARGDLIDEDGSRYQVLPPGGDEPFARRSGDNWRIHAKRIGDTP